MLSFIHTADVHLDAPLASLGDLYEVRQHDFRLTMQTIRDVVKDKQVDFWLIAGDLIEYHGGTRATALFLNELFTSVDPIPVLIAPGNHDPWMEGSFYQTLDWPPNVFFFTNEWGAYEFPDKQTVIYGWGFPHAHVADSPLESFPGKLEGYHHHLMVLHGTVLTQEDWGHQPYAPLPLSRLEEVGMDYIALGHIHKAHQFIHSSRSVPIAAYPGSPEGLTSKETGERHVIYGQIEPQKGLQLSTIPVSTRQIQRVTVTLDGVETMEGLISVIHLALAHYNKNHLLYVTLEGQRASHLTPSLELLQTQFRDYYYLQFQDQTYPDIDVERLIQDNGLIGKWLVKLREARDQAATPEEQDVAQLALQEAIKRIGGSLQ
ncbi:metallophosphoesterase family protein [Brevibacillus ginsengisoli]|uniref:metallophosphoesterase family protein n=1 Tax=Brevibacillus ginsengisoli TaxID=363854 RepID=UPI003CF0B6EB